MSYRLVVAEKPSVGAAYAKVLGATNRLDGYWEGNGYLVSWCMLYNPGTRLGLVQELRLMQCYLLPDETALWELSEGVIGKMERMTDAEFSELEFPLD